MPLLLAQQEQALFLACLLRQQEARQLLLVRVKALLLAQQVAGLGPMALKLQARQVVLARLRQTLAVAEMQLEQDQVDLGLIKRQPLVLLVADAVQLQPHLMEELEVPMCCFLWQVAQEEVDHLLLMAVLAVPEM